MPPTIRRLLTGKYFLFSAGALLLYTLVGFLVLPSTLGWYVPKAAHDQFNYRVSLGKIRINPFQMTFEVTDFSLAGPDGAPMASFERLFLDWEPTDIFHRTAKFSEFSLSKPALHLVIAADGETNFSKLTPKSAAPESPPSSSTNPIRLLLQTVAIVGGEMTVTDKRPSVPETITFHDLALNLKDLSTIQNQNGTYSLSTTTGNGETIQGDGNLGLVPFRSSGQLACLNIQTATLWGFVRDTLSLESPTGKIDASTGYRIDASSTPLQVTLENFKVSLADTSLKLTNSDGPFFKLSKLDVASVQLDLATKSIQVGKVLVDGGKLHFLVDDSGTSNLEKILRKSPSQEKKAVASAPPEPQAQQASPPDAAPWTMDFETIEVKDIGFDLEDVNRILPLTAGISSLSVSAKARIEAGSKSTKILIQQLAAELKKVQVGNKGAPDPLLAVDRFFLAGGEMDLDARILKVASLGLSDGRVSLNRDEKGIINLEQLFSARGTAPSRSPVPEILPWKIDATAVEIKDIAFGFEDLSTATPATYGVASISVNSRVEIRTGPKNDVVLKGIATELKGLRLGSKGSKDPVFAAQRFFVEGGELDLGARTVTIPVVGLSDGRLDVSRDRDGKLNMEKLFTAKHSVPVDRKGKQATADSGLAWKYSVKSFELKGFRSALSDQKANSKKPLYQLQGLRMQATNIDGHSPMGVDLKFGTTPGGTVALLGKINPTNQSIDAKIKVIDLPLTPLQPYLEPSITLTLQSASVSTEGTLRYGVPKTGSKIAYDGSFSLDKLRLTAPGSKETYLGWESLQIPKIKLNVKPNNLQIKEVRLKKPLGQLIIAEDRTVNLAKIVKEQPAKNGLPPANTSPKDPITVQGEEGGEPFPFSIGKVLVEDGDIVFADLSMKPNFMTRIHSLKGMVSRLSSSGNSLTEIQLDGSVDQYGYTKITGTLDLYNIKRAAEINMVFQNVELTSVTPYSGKFAGRSIKSGKLSMDLDYKIQDNQMLGDNKIIVDNLELGEHVDSPDAINLPLDLAVALLKDSNGIIDIGLPVSGDLNDPQFSIGPLVWKAFTNLITKAITAPFLALGSLFGGDAEKFDAVVFEPGKADLLPPEKGKLKQISDALHKRQQLTLVMQGQYSPEADGLELKQKHLQRAVGILLGEEVSAGEEPGPLDLDDAQTRGALEKIFAERFGAPALSELNRGVKEGTVKARPMEVSKPEQDKTGKQNRFWEIVQGAKLYRLVPGAKSPEQSALLATEIYARLIDSEPVAEQELLQLAGKRAQAVGAELQNSCGIPATRIVTKDSGVQANAEGRSVKLSLDALGSAP